MYKTTVSDNCDTHQPICDKNVTNQNFHRKSFRYLPALLPFALILLISTSYQRSPENINFEQEYYSSGIRDTIKQYLLFFENDTALVKNVSARSYITHFYTDNGYRPVWLYYNGLNQRAKELLGVIEHSREFGLEPENYHFTAIKNKANALAIKNEPASVAELELLLTDAAFRFMIHLHAGYRPLDSSLFVAPWVTQLQDILRQGIAGGKLSEAMISVEPQFIEYQKLRKANSNYVRSTTLNDQMVTIEYPSKDTAKLYFEVKGALISLGYMTTEDNIKKALQKFQQHHGLYPDGKPGLNTVEALSKSTLYRYRVLALNLDRLRKKEYTDRDLLYVNIPAYRMKIFRNNNLSDTFRVIVGNPSSPTPLISGDMQRIIANPVWYVPRSIAINEILPKIKEDSNYLARNGMTVLDRNYRPVNSKSINVDGMHESSFEYTFRQKRGSENSLGQVKFIFSNPYAVYLHDTPGKSLFQKDIRAFSHGCIRVEHPERLAEYILSHLNSDTTNFSQLIESGRQQEFAVNSKLPVHITYITCEADDNGELYFYKDIYGMDGKELDELNTLMGI